MLESLLTALEITALGMGLVFVAILVLWGMMWGLTAIPMKADADESDSPAETTPEPVPASEAGFKAQAAAVAVAIALAEQSLSSAHPLPQPPTALVSAWQLGTRTRQLYEKGGQRRQLGTKRQ
jgi:Na+-transporting methylmalonyl-CoA/oxaloacetate decarboxylase gamma subunit